MIIEFTVGNFLSFDSKKTINFEAKALSELKENVIEFEKDKILRSIVVYGANSSGKSNLLKALDRMRDCVILSVKLNDDDELDHTPFLLSIETEHQATFFEIIFIDNKNKYRYGFEYNLHKIVNEWLFVSKKSSETALFIRTEEGIAVSDKFEEGIGHEESTNDNRLFLSLVAQLGGNLSKTILKWFKSYHVLSGIDHKDYQGYSLKMLNEKLPGSDEALSFLQKLKLGFEQIQITESEFNSLEIPETLPKSIKSKLIKQLSGKTMVKLKTIHTIYDKEGNTIGDKLFNKDTHESDGTNKLIDFCGPIFDTLLLGNLLIIDELDSKLHSLITRQIINFFNNPETNPNNAQLLFSTHDTNLLSTDIFRRDQIWFTEKDEVEKTDLYSLCDIYLPDGSKVRNDSNIEKNYIRGRYGAIPFITN